MLVYAVEVALGQKDSQSSSVIDRMMSAFVYMRMLKTVVVTERHMTIVRITYLSKYRGSSKFGMTPAGGIPAGPLRSCWSAA